MRLTNIAAQAVHNLVVFVANLKRTDVNEQYVRRVLQEQVGIDPVDLGVIALNHRHVLRLSVRHNIDPVVSFFRSQGLTGSALAHFLSCSPETLGRDVDEYLVPLCDFLRERVGGRGIVLLVRHPGLADVPPAHLAAAYAELKQSGVDDESIELLLWQYPELYARLARALHGAKKGWMTEVGSADGADAAQSAALCAVGSALRELVQKQKRGEETHYPVENDIRAAIGAFEDLIPPW